MKMDSEQAELRRQQQESSFQEGMKLVDEIITRLGYEEKSNLEELGLTAEQIKKIIWTKENKGVGTRLLMSQRRDGEIVKAIINVLKTYGSPTFAADIFTPSIL
ncbi:MAG: hypothetical protein PHU73_04305 [Patescibacteria group bacterium]|nr:hypothetical protein [Patescibacteria group bacterium]